MEDKSLYDIIYEQVKNIDTSTIDDSKYQEGSLFKVIEPQRVYIWIRVYLKEELSDINIGDDFEIKYLTSGESIMTKFICYSKKNLNKNVDDDIINYQQEDDNKILCLMVDEEVIKKSNDIPFIRTLFKTSPYFELQVIRREELVFTNQRTNQQIEYVDVDF